MKTALNFQKMKIPRKELNLIERLKLQLRKIYIISRLSS